MKPKLVRIDWVDTVSNNGWRTEDGPKEALAKCSTVGWLVGSTREAKTLAATIGDMGEGDRRLGDRVIIPRGCIKSIRKLRA